LAAAVRAAALGVAAALLMAAPAGAAVVRYAGPGGPSSGECTDASPGGSNPPCAFKYALETAADDGDEVIVQPGDHSISSDVIVTDKTLNVHGQSGQPRPRILADPTSLAALSISGAGASGTVVRYLEFRAGLRGHEVSGGSARMEDLVIVDTDTPSAGGGAAVVVAGGWTLSDTLARSEEDGGAGVITTDGSSHLRNVTAIGSAPDGRGIVATSSFLPVCLVPKEATLTAKNVIARGGAWDLRAAITCGGDTVTVRVSYSNVRIGKLDDDPPKATIVPEGNNQFESEPLFAGPLDYHQLPGSPTIDAGTADPLLGPVDFDGHPRTIGAAPDIGADEFAPAPAGSGGAGLAADTLAARASVLRIRPATFRALERGGSIAAARGTRVSYSLSEAATMTFRVERTARGRRVGRRCVPQTRRNRKRKRCTRYTRVRGSFTHQGRTGGNSFRFSGRLRGRKLRPGRYRLAVVPTDAAGNRGNTVRATFRIVRR
jgi:hypothetical protein